jgi:hypothetical protein
MNFLDKKSNKKHLACGQLHLRCIAAVHLLFFYHKVDFTFNND